MNGSGRRQRNLRRLGHSYLPESWDYGDAGKWLCGEPSADGIFRSKPGYLPGERRIKSKLYEAHGLPNRNEVSLIGMTAHFGKQKGIDPAARSADKILRLDTQMILLGSDDQ
jgi:hypothetical protein